MVQCAQSIMTWRYLDPHFIIPMLDFMEESQLIAAEELGRARKKTVSATGMVDYLVELYQESNDSVPSELELKKAEITNDIESKQSLLKPLLVVIESEGIDSIKNLSLADFCLKYNLSTDVLDVLFDYSRLLYQVGDYKTSSELLRIYRMLTASSETSSIPTERQIRAMWGSIACYIAQAEYKSASELLVKLIEFFDTTTLPKDKFSSGASAIWLLHWSILTLLKSPIEDIVNQPLVTLLLREKYLGIVSVSAPYLWRYISALIILSGATVPSDMAKQIQKDSDAASDALNRILIEVYSKYEFDSAVQVAESELATLAKADYYLVDHSQVLKEKALELIRSVRQKLYS
jgi:translation initiation factor 3 subunit E